MGIGRFPTQGLAPRHAPVSTPMIDTYLYRPSALLALPFILVPAALSLSGIVLLLETGQHIPVWLPLLLLLWIPCLPGLWVLMKSVRWSATGLAVARPWQQWAEIAWEDIERVERRGISVQVVSANGAAMRFTPLLLHDGVRLKRQLMLRLPSHVLQGDLRVEAQHLITGEAYPAQDAAMSGTLSAQPRTLFTVLPLIVATILTTGAVLALLYLPLITGILCALVAVCGAGVSVALGVWMRQTILATERGVVVTHVWQRQGVEMTWQEIGMIECANYELMLRLRGDTRLRMAGPGVLPAAHRDLLRAFIRSNCLDRGVPVIYNRRWWL